MAIFKLSHLQLDIINILIEEKLIWKLIFSNSIIIIFDTVISYLLYKISDNNLNLIYLYVFIDILNRIINLVYINKINNDISIIIETKFIKNATHQYEKLSFNSKNKATAEQFYIKMKQSSNAILNIITWGFPTLINLCNTFIQSILIFYYKNKLYPLCVLVIINYLIYIFYIKNKQTEYSAATKSANDKNDKMKSQLNLLLPMFQHNEKKPDDILELVLKIKLNWYNTDKLWNHIILITSLINKSGIILISVGYNNTVPNFLLLMKIISNFNNAITSLSNFLNQYNRYETNYMSYVDFFSNLEYKIKPANVKFTKPIKIIRSDIRVGDFSLVLNETITIHKNDKILIKGRTGHGKSTFINALMGKIDGLILDKHKPENYYHLFVDMYQNIREKLPTSNITIRELFDNELDDTVIMECLLPCFFDDDLDKIFSNLSSDLSKLTNPLDIDINERLSGGEKTRLALSTRIYQMKKSYYKQILILDEPEQGLDPDIAIRVINNIFILFNDKTIIMITHICNCNIERLDIKWNTRLRINKGIISKI